MRPPSPTPSLTHLIVRIYISHVSKQGNGRVSLFLNFPYSWNLTCCQEGAPLGRRTLLSRSIQPNYTQRWCQWSFPDGKFNKIPASPMLERWNKFGGLSLQTDRLAQVDGGIDPWQYAYVPVFDFSSTLETWNRPADASIPPMELKEQTHCSVLIIRSR
jgi:hypothetical protein